jgi:hypothetical protein
VKLSNARREWQGRESLNAHFVQTVLEATRSRGFLVVLCASAQTIECRRAYKGTAAASSRPRCVLQLGNAMQQDFQPPFLQPLIRLAQANVALFTSTCIPGQSASAWATAGTANPIEMSVRMLQGLAKNYVEFLTELSQSGLGLSSAGRAGLVTLAHEL